METPKYTISNNLTNQPCWCDCRESSTVCQFDRWGQPCPSVQCKNCGTIRLDPRMTQEQCSQYYKEIFADIQGVEQMLDGQKSMNIHKYFPAMLQTNGHNRILDYGCGPGGKLHYFVKNGWRVYGYDVNEKFMKSALEQGLLPHKKENRYDYLYLSHCIEHVADPLYFLAEIVGNLEDEGLIIIELPFLERLLCGCREKGIQGDIQFVHTWYFTIASLDRLMGRLGCRRTYFNGGFLAVYIKDMEPRYFKPTPIKDWLFLKKIKVCSLPGIRRILSKINDLTKTVPNYHDS